MKQFILAFGLVLLGSHYSNAQSSNGVNCSALSGTPLICLKNMTSFAIVGVQATTNSNYGTWIPIPGGPIPPGGTSIVNFGNYNGKCVMYVAIRTASGQTHSYSNVDVCHSTSFTITGW